MQYKRIEDVLENKTKNYDSKHILNLAPNKIIPNDVLERLRKDGLTIERKRGEESQKNILCEAFAEGNEGNAQSDAKSV